jgi:hypothetical protein
MHPIETRDYQGNLGVHVVDYIKMGLKEMKDEIVD